MTKPESYIQKVLSGEQIVSKWVRLAIERHSRDLETASERGLRFDEDKGLRVILFIERFIVGT